jgi:hypothetical protein
MRKKDNLLGLAGLGIASIPEALGLTLGLTVTDLIERIRRIIEQHREVDRGDTPGVACGCQAEGLSDHPRHVAEQIVDRLKLRPESVNNVRNKIRYASAWFDDELTKLEGAE